MSAIHFVNKRNFNINHVYWTLIYYCAKVSMNSAVSESHDLKKWEKNPAKTWKMHEDLQLMHLLFTKASSAMVSVEG